MKFEKMPEAEPPALETYGRDLTQLAGEGKLDPVIGRDEEIRPPYRYSRAGRRTTLSLFFI